MSCKLTEANWDVAKTDISEETINKKDAELFFERLRCHFIKFLFLPSIAREIKFLLKIDEVPPIINPLASGDILYNSEHLNDSKILKNREKLYGNQELLMHCLKEGHLVLDQLDSYTNTELLTLCQKLDFQNLSR